MLPGVSRMRLEELGWSGLRATAKDDKSFCFQFS
jgi:hypothetical protein